MLNVTELTELICVERPASSLKASAKALAKDQMVAPFYQDGSITSFLLHSQSVSPIEIPERFSPSLLPPSFPSGRCAVIFIRGKSAGLSRHAAADSRG
jgi:hypothetical protein